MRDRTAQTEPLTIGQRIVAKWEGPASGWSEPADLAEAIDAAFDAEREACARLAAEFPAHTHGCLLLKPADTAAQVAREIAAAIRARKEGA